MKNSKFRLFSSFLLILSMSLCACSNSVSKDSSTESANTPPQGTISEGEPEESTETSPSLAEESPSNETEPATSQDSIGTTSLRAFQAIVSEDPNQSAEVIANRMLSEADYPFDGIAMPVEPGFLNGFSSEIQDFSEGCMFSPMIGSIPFVGYVFKLEESTDLTAFEKQLSDNADLRWNICTEADEMILNHYENTVFFLMCPITFDEQLED